ncbi:PREDICTED: death domain-containing membrane protein NRADD-like [Dipodomys ordii]|uniref:Death domain-containing membrane protein NRADD-like n=1 Tax=Dipodomys ordii TaxID=10020 RepID=A0A1S3GBW2_DIPOR|nr:PREDICTED: death domain-containing membrane protein NRADD-like [Dipodomys ordii]
MMHTDKPLSTQDMDEVWVGTGEVLSPNTSSPFPPEPPGTSGSIIPVYCALLSTVVLGLLAYVVFKCWRSRKHRQQLAKVRTAELGVLDQRPGEESTIFLDSPGGTEPSSHAQGKSLLHLGSPWVPPTPHAALGLLYPDCRLYLHLPRKQQEEVERLLEVPGEADQGWRALAGLLGYEVEAVETISRSQEPAYTLLRDWAAQEGSRATLRVLRDALAALHREDVLQALGPLVEGDSVV